MFAVYEFEKKGGDFPDFTWCWSAIELQKYNPRSRSDTSDTSYLQKCSPNVVWYFWSPGRTSYSSKKSFFLPLHSSIPLTFPVQELTPPRQSSNAPLPWDPRHMRWSNVRWVVQVSNWSANIVKQLFLISKISGPNFFSGRLFRGTH